MNPAATPTVELAVDILLQSIYDENKNALEDIIYGDRSENDTSMLTQVDDYAGAIKSTLDDVQRHLFRRMSALHTEHNKMIPLHRLPIELFVQVMAGLLEQFQTRHWSGGTHLRRLVTIRRVCKRWRDVIDRTPSLWATIDILDPPAVISTALSRSANHPLNIIGAPKSGSIEFVHNPPPRRDEFVKTAILHSKRWRSCQLVVASLEEALAIMNAPAPLLQNLEVKSMVPSRLHLQEGQSALQEAGPRLRRLRFHGLATAWDPRVLCDLRHLCLSGLDDLTLRCEDVLGILRECPGLEEVDLSIRQTTTFESSKREPPFTLTQLRSMDLTPLNPSFTLALLETICAPSIQCLFLNLDFSNSGHLAHSVIKRARATFSTAIDAQYQLEILVMDNFLRWECSPIDGPPSGWRFRVETRNKPQSEILELLLAEKHSNRFALESVEIEFDSTLSSELDSCLRKLDNTDRIQRIFVSGCSPDSLFTYMSSATTSNEWGFPELENLTIYSCVYDPQCLLDMVLARYGMEGSVGDEVSENRSLPPPLKWMEIHHAPDEADYNILNLVEDIVGDDHFQLEEDLEP